MRFHRQTEDYEVGYGKPPKSGQFKKGMSGNPLGRPKKAADFGPQLLRELNSKPIINESGKRRTITKLEGLVKQVVNKGLSGSLPATRLAIASSQQELERLAEEQQRVLHKANRPVEELSLKELDSLIRAELEKSTLDGADDRKPGNRRIIGK